MSLARPFALAVGPLVSRWIGEVVARNTANTTAPYMERRIAPVMQALASRERLTLEARLEVDRLRTDPEGGRHQSLDSRCGPASRIGPGRAGRSARPFPVQIRPRPGLTMPA